MGLEKEGVAVKYDNVSKVFGENKVVKDISIEVNKGEYLILLGPSGCGKTTTLRMLAGLETPTEGDIYIDKVNVKHLHPKDRDIAMVFQNYALYPHMTVYDNLSFPLEAKKIPKAMIKEKIMAVAEILGISDYLYRRPKQLSGGEAQRVALGRAIIREPRVFLMDEPLSNLDAKLRIEMRDELLRLHRKLKVTTIYVTHDQEEAMTLGDRLAVFKKGELQQIGIPQDIYNRPQNRFVAEFIGNPKMNIFEGVLDSSGVFTHSSDETLKYKLFKDKITLPGNRSEYQVLLGIRPEDVKLIKKPKPDTWKAKIDLVEVMGRDLRVCVMIGNDIYTILAPIDLQLKYGEVVYLLPDKNKIHVFDQETEMRIEETAL
jgi:multiple sugar transport system ATP-binding protein